MNHHIACEQTVQRLEENRLEYLVLPVGGAMKVLVTQRGGRILGPFEGDRGESILWMNGAFSEKEKFAEFLASGDWNLGGDRIWLAPELQYNVKDRNDFFGTYVLPAQLDPGDYTLRKLDGPGCSLSQEMTLPMYNAPRRSKGLVIERTIVPAADPLAELDRHDDLLRGVAYCGFEHRINLRETENDGCCSETWDLAQVNPGGNLYLSTLPAAEHTDYYRPIDDEYLQAFPGYVRLKIDGVRQYKIGYKAVHFLGRVGYLNALEDGREYLFVRHYFSNPSAVYTKEPPQTPGCKGHPIHVYNDDGSYGGFAEVECSGQALGGDTGRASSEDLLLTWLYVGSSESIRRIAWSVMGVEG